MTGFVKLDTGILDSSLWAEDATTRIVFITLLAMAGPSGLCESTAPGIAHRANLPDEVVRTALDRLSEPDVDSRSSVDDGRRIRRVDGGYLIVNYGRYRKKDYTTAERSKRYRESKSVTRDVTARHGTSRRSHGASRRSDGVTRRERKHKHMHKHKRSSNKQSGSPSGSGSMSQPGAPEEQLSSTESRSLRSLSAAALQVFDYWRTTMNKPRAVLDVKRRKVIEARLADGYDAETLCRAVDGCRHSLWHQGANDRAKKFDDLELICRDAKHVDEFLDIAANGEARPMSRTTERNARALGLLDLNLPKPLPPLPKGGDKPEDP